MAKRKRFDDFHRYYPDLPRGWGLYDDKEIEEKVFWATFLYASKHFEEKFRAGDEEVIFKFVKNYPESLREVWTFPDGTTHPCYSNNNVFLREHGRSWVIEQIEKWKNENTKGARKKLKDLFKNYTDGRGREAKPPKNDWIIYRQIKERISKGMKFDDAVFDLMKKADDGCLDPETQKILTKHINDDEAGYYNTFNEIYHELKKLEKKYEEEQPITEKNLRFEYFLPHKGVKIPKKYEAQFNKELSLYCAVEWLRKGFISFPRIRSRLSIYSGVKPFEEERLPLKEALERVSKEKNVPLNKLKEIYTNLKNLEALYYDSDRLEVLKEL
jgi:hypothetical protein